MGIQWEKWERADDGVSKESVQVSTIDCGNQAEEVRVQGRSDDDHCLIYGSFARGIIGGARQSFKITSMEAGYSGK